MIAAGRALLLTGFVVACAQPGIPPGGPVDKDPPQLTGVSPDTGATNVRPRSVLIRFDEVVNERSTPLAASGTRPATGGGYGNQMGSSLGTLVVVSPGDGRERVSWRRTAIEIEPRGGFRPNTTYRVTLLPGLGDLRGNTLKEPIEIVFSTGTTRTMASVAGAIFDWVGNKHAPNASIEVFTAADTMLRWRATSDSLGRFAVRDLAPGTYRLRGWLDTDGDRVTDPREAFDTLTFTVDTTTAAELYAFVHDTLGPRIESLEPVDSTAVRVKFDRGVAVDWSPDTLTAVLMRADSSVVPLVRMIPATVHDSLRKLAAAKADSAKPAPDTTGADTAAVRVADTSVSAGARPPGRTAPRIETVRDGLPLGAPRDTTPRIPPPKLNRPAPVLSWVIEPSVPLVPGEYRLKIRGVPSLTGHVRPSEREFRLRPPPAPADSTKPPTRPAAPGDRAAPATTTPRPAPARPRPPR